MIRVSHSRGFAFRMLRGCLCLAVLTISVTAIAIPPKPTEDAKKKPSVEAILQQLRIAKTDKDIDSLIAELVGDADYLPKAAELLFDEKVSMPARKAIAVVFVMYSIDTKVIQRLLALPPDDNSEQLKTAILKSALGPGSHMGLAIDDVKALIQRAKDSKQVLDLARQYLKEAGE